MTSVGLIQIQLPGVAMIPSNREVYKNAILVTVILLTIGLSVTGKNAQQNAGTKANKDEEFVVLIEQARRSQKYSVSDGKPHQGRGLATGEHVAIIHAWI
jgi:hypothetical protein